MTEPASDMIERVARAIHDAECSCGCWREPSKVWRERGLVSPYDLAANLYHSPDQIEDWVAAARAAIAAMREPTEAMFMRGGNVEPYNRAQTGRMLGKRIGDLPARDCWRIMIDWALAPY
jgi:hypothetical protein